MNTLAEIESAIERLPAEDLTALREWLAQRELSATYGKWRRRGKGVVKAAGGVDAYLRQVRRNGDDHSS
jgi:hypothetical protein